MSVCVLPSQFKNNSSSGIIKKNKSTEMQMLQQNDYDSFDISVKEI